MCPVLQRSLASRQQVHLHRNTYFNHCVMLISLHCCVIYIGQEFSACQVAFGHSCLKLPRLAMRSREQLSETATIIISAQVGNSINQIEDGWRSHLWGSSSTGLERPSFYRHLCLITPSFQETLKTYLFNVQ